MDILAGLILIPYGLLGTFRATQATHRNRLPVVDCAVMAMIGVMLVFGGLGVLLGAPVALPIVAVLAIWRALALYNARLLRGRLQRRDFWPAAAPELALALAVVVGGR